MAVKPAQHPLGPVTGLEITQASALIKASWPAGTDLHFKTITLQEPTKAELAPYLTAERAGQPTLSIDRRAFILYYIKGTVSQPLALSSHLAAHR